MTCRRAPATVPSAAGSQRTARPRLRPLGVRVLAEPFSANVKVQARLVGTDAHVLGTERLFAAHTRSPRAPPRAPPQFRTASCGGRQRLNPGLLIVGATKALSPHLRDLRLTPTPTPLPIPYPYPYPTRYPYPYPYPYRHRPGEESQGGEQDQAGRQDGRGKK